MKREIEAQKILEEEDDEVARVFEKGYLSRKSIIRVTSRVAQVSTERPDFKTKE